MEEGFSVIFSKSTLKDLKPIPAKFQSKILTAIKSLAYDHLRGEKLWGRLEGKKKLKIWPYRVVYIVDKLNKKIIILEIGHRQGIYR